MPDSGGQFSTDFLVVQAFKASDGFFEPSFCKPDEH